MLLARADEVGRVGLQFVALQMSPNGRSGHNRGEAFVHLGRERPEADIDRTEIPQRSTPLPY